MNDRDILQLIDDEYIEPINGEKKILSKDDIYNEAYNGLYISIGIKGGKSFLPETGHHYFKVMKKDVCLYNSLDWGQNLFSLKSAINAAKRMIDEIVEGIKQT